jgi:UDP-N-acetylmuramoyl-tripeptide--D-alanyl-D-alanine ligase
VIPLTLAQVADAVGGTLAAADPARLVTGPVVADSRLAGPGALFVALPGDRVDGHRFAESALAAGAVAVLAAREVGVPAVLVDDPLAALGRLARAVVDRLPGLTVVGLTGSSGKTTTKDLLAGLLGLAGPTVAPEGSYNNELGLPLTALTADAGSAFLVAEMGARGLGHIRHLCGITPPRVGLVLNVGAAHLGEFGSREVTARAKGELVEALPPDGIAVLNADDPLVAAMATRTEARVVRFGTGDGVEVRAVDVTLDEQARPRFRLVAEGGEALVALRLHGRHQVGNALAAAAVALAVGLPVDRVAAGLSQARPVSRWRMEVTARPDGIVVVNDAYNANPDSVAAALDALATMTPPSGPAHRRWAVLGEMLELGPDGEQQHVELGALAARLGIDRLVAVGAGGRPYRDGFGSAAAEAGSRSGSGDGGDALRVGSGGDGAAVLAGDVPAALDLLRRELAPGDVVLVKASRAIGLDRLAAQLLVDPLGPDTDDREGVAVGGAGADRATGGAS